MIQPISSIQGMWGYAQYKNHPGKDKEKKNEIKRKELAVLSFSVDSMINKTV